MSFRHKVHVPFCQNLQNRPTLSPAPYHPGCVKCSQEASSTTSSHWPEGLQQGQKHKTLCHYMEKSNFQYHKYTVIHSFLEIQVTFRHFQEAVWLDFEYQNMQNKTLSA